MTLGSLLKNTNIAQPIDVLRDLRDTYIRRTKERARNIERLENALIAERIAFDAEAAALARYTDAVTAVAPATDSKVVAP